MRVESVTNKEIELQKATDTLKAMAQRRKITVEQLIVEARANEISPTPTQARILLLAERIGK